MSKVVSARYISYDVVTDRSEILMPVYIVQTKETCPKCKSEKIWFEVHDSQTLKRCMCGFSMWIFKVTRDGSTLRRGKVSLPRKDTKLFQLLVLVLRNAPTTTQQLANSSDDESSRVGTRMSVLHASGLVTKLVDNKGKAGGSVWELSKRAKELLA